MADGAKGTDQKVSASETALYALRIGVRVLIILVLIAFAFWFYQKIDANFERQALIENKEFGALREELDEDFTGDEIVAIDGPVLLYGYSKKQPLDVINFDEASGHTLVNPRTGEERELSGDGRKAIEFRTVEREVPLTDPEEDGPQTERRAFAYVARLATRQMYLDGTSDLVVGNLQTLEQREIAKGVSFLDAVVPGENDDEIAIVLWLGPQNPRHMVIDTSTLEVVSERDISMPEASTFMLDRAARDREAHGKEDAPELAVPVPAERPRPQRPPR